MYLCSMEMHLFKNIELNNMPERMNNPFSYEPHPLCIEACRDLQAELSQRNDWREEINRGKMFGVLIVEADNGKIGYLRAYSGQIGGRSDWEGFVPAVFDYLQPDGYFKKHEAEISELNQQIRQLEANETLKKAKSLIDDLQQKRQEVIANYQTKIKEAKEKRDARRQEALSAGKSLSQKEEEAMIKESQFMKAELKRLKKSINEKTALETEYEVYEKDLNRAKKLRKELSEALQQWLFAKFEMLNAEGESKDLLEIFKDEAIKIPPAGSGECCEPKLLQYAYQHGYKPLQMAMFWWGESPKEEIRHHLQFYPACNGKCKPILHWMLPKTVFETQQTEATIYNKVETLYEDRELAVIYKPEGLLSVPGKDAAQPSVYTLMRRKYQEATGPLIVHRLDMATSGLMIIAKTEFAYHRLQKEFLNHRVQKKYVAIVCGKDKESCNRILKEAESGRGYISLPLMADFLDRPRQIVNREQGKEAITEYEVLERIDDTHLRLALYPKTGRTHQLRVHCAHQEGLNAPIIGDPLYGNETATRLHLHAEEITFEHPMTGKKMTITRKADF